MEPRKKLCGTLLIISLHHLFWPAVRFVSVQSGMQEESGADLAPELKVVSNHIFVKTKANALTSGDFSEYIRENGIDEFYITGADATACVKSTCFNMTKTGYTVHVIADCVTSYNLKKMPEMLAYYADQGCAVKTLAEYMESN